MGTCTGYTIDTCIELAVARNMYGMLNQMSTGHFGSSLTGSQSATRKERKIFAVFSSFRRVPLYSLILPWQLSTLRFRRLLLLPMQPWRPLPRMDPRRTGTLWMNPQPKKWRFSGNRTMPVDEAHPGSIDDASLQQMADSAACVERLQIARDQLSPVSSTAGSVLARVGLEPTKMEVDESAGAPSPDFMKPPLRLLLAPRGRWTFLWPKLRTSLYLELRYRPCRGFLFARPRRCSSTPSASRSTSWT